MDSLEEVGEYSLEEGDGDSLGALTIGLDEGLNNDSAAACSLEGYASGLAGGRIGNSSSTVSTRMDDEADGIGSSASGTMGNEMAGRCWSMALLTAR